MGAIITTTYWVILSKNVKSAQASACLGAGTENGETNNLSPALIEPAHGAYLHDLA